MSPLKHTVILLTIINTISRSSMKPQATHTHISVTYITVLYCMLRVHKPADIRWDDVQTEAYEEENNHLACVYLSVVLLWMPPVSRAPPSRPYAQASMKHAAGGIVSMLYFTQSTPTNRLMLLAITPRSLAKKTKSFSDSSVKRPEKLTRGGPPGGVYLREFQHRERLQNSPSLFSDYTHYIL